MTDGLLLTPEMERQRKLENDILAIEGLFFAINSATYSPKFMDSLTRGLTYLGSVHSSLLAQMTPEELKAMRQKYNATPSQPSKETEGIPA